jgi:hypothetical protein
MAWNKWPLPEMSQVLRQLQQDRAVLVILPDHENGGSTIIRKAGVAESSTP